MAIANFQIRPYYATLKVAAELSWRIRITPTIKYINGLNVNAEIPKYAVFNDLKGKKDPKNTYEYGQQ